MSHALAELLEQGTPDTAAIDTFLQGNDFPLVRGEQVTFVFRGEADEVRLRHFIYGLPTSQPFVRWEGTDLWSVELQIPRGSRVEYKIERIRGDHAEWIHDPLNDRLAHDPFGANSVCHGDGYEAPAWAEPDPDARPGTLEAVTIRSAALGSTRELLVYLPARFRKRRRYPLLVAHDGDDYLRYSRMQAVLDNLIHRQEIPPIIVAFTRPADRLREYAADPRHARHLVEELVPALERRYPLMGRAGARGLMGASFGGVSTLFAAWKYPGFFGRLMLQSGSFAFSDIGDHQRGPTFDPVAEFVNEFREQPGRPTDRVFVSCGTYESLIYENRSIIPLLQSTGMQVRYVEARDGHNWENWRDRMREGLSWLFPGPLWMIYE